MTSDSAGFSTKYGRKQQTLHCPENLKFNLMKQDDAIGELVHDLGLELKEDRSGEARGVLVEHINALVEKDFQQLITILYRMDVNENKLRSMLRDNPNADAGSIIADLMIERQAQKIKSRNEFKAKNDDIPEDEKW